MVTATPRLWKTLIHLFYTPRAKAWLKIFRKEWLDSKELSLHMLPSPTAS